MDEDSNEGRFPFFRVVLICAYIVFLSLGSVFVDPAVKSGFIMAAIGAFVLMLRIDREAVAPLLPSDAFSLRSATGTALWMVLLLSVAYSPLAIYVPLFLQRLHGVNPLVAGYMLAGASLAWTSAALAVASLTEEWPRRLIVTGPIVMGALCSRWRRRGAWVKMPLRGRSAILFDNLRQDGRASDCGTVGAKRLCGFQIKALTWIGCSIGSSAGLAPRSGS